LVDGSLGHPMNRVLAKGGLRLDDKFDTQDLRNTEIVRMFFARTPNDRLEFETLTGIRDIIEFDTDLVRKEVSRRVNMEYDWKRKPDILFDHEDYRHCAFSTAPWATVDQFKIVRDLFEKYLDSDPHCIKSVGDFDSLSVYIDANMQLPEEERAYLRKRAGDLNRLRMVLCAAWHHDDLGVRANPSVATAQQFADVLTACGVKCSRFNVENGKKQPFTTNSVPPTESALAAILKLESLFPEITADRICAVHVSLVSIKPRLRPLAELRPRGADYYAGYDIPGVGRLFPKLQSHSEIRRQLELPYDFVEPKSTLSWQTRDEYGLED